MIPLIAASTASKSSAVAITYPLDVRQLRPRNTSNLAYRVTRDSRRCPLCSEIRCCHFSIRKIYFFRGNSLQSKKSEKSTQER
jgi:hypothetical protein